MNRLAFACFVLGLGLLATIQSTEPPLRIATFQVDATPERVTVHTLHQHAATGSDFAIKQVLAQPGLNRL